MRIPMRAAAIVAVVIGVLGTALSAQTSTGPSHPFGNLFATPRADKPKPPVVFAAPFGADRSATPVVREQPRTKITCGLTLIPADSSLDPAMPHPRPEQGPRYALQTVAPPMCRQ
jgi:hypothetical protein